VLTPLVSDVPGLARFTDPNLVNPWGLSLNSTDPFWISDNGTGVSTLLDGRGQSPPLVVQTPGAGGSIGTPTGTVFNGGDGFVVSEDGRAGPSQFLFATEDGLILGWSAGVDVTHALVAVDNSQAGAIYKGLALATNSSGTFLYAANFSSGKIDVFDQGFHPAQLSGSFSDPAIPSGFAPFNIQNLGGQLFVTYAKHGADWIDDAPGPGNGFVDVFDTNGNLLRRLVSGGPLNSPWGLALAPAGFGTFGNDLLVGNTGDGRINAFNPQTGAFVGQLTDAAGIPISINQLWGLSFGNGGGTGSQNTLYFAAGIDYEQHGLFGKIEAVQGNQSPGGQGSSADFNEKDFSSYLQTILANTDAYPLPPASGPALQIDVTIQPPASPVLLPVTDSSFVMAPALLTVSPRDAGGAFISSTLPASPVASNESIYTIARGTQSPGARGDLTFALSGSSVAEARHSTTDAPGKPLDLVLYPSMAVRPAKAMTEDRDRAVLVSMNDDGIADRLEMLAMAIPDTDSVDSAFAHPASAELRDGVAVVGDRAEMASSELRTPRQWAHASGARDWIVRLTALLAVYWIQFALTDKGEESAKALKTE
jgi:uncharacterized protein (TIGR03118 family)